MAITGRVPLLLLLGVVAVVLRPELSTMWLWVLVVGVLVAVDVALAPAPRAVDVVRRPPGRVRAGHDAPSTLELTNTGRRGVALLVRDAWQPSAGARDNRHRLRLTAGSQQAVTTWLRPHRRGELRAAAPAVAPGPAPGAGRPVRSAGAWPGDGVRLPARVRPR